MSQITVVALYKFVRLNNIETMRRALLALMKTQKVKGTLLLAAEGINGTIAGPQTGIDTILDWLKTDSRLANLSTKTSYNDNYPFYRTKVKLKKEIVTMGVEGIDPNKVVGSYVEAKNWNTLIADPDVLVIDTRNDYEVQIGSFKNAINPQTQTFRELPSFIQKKLDDSKHKKIAMYCTGGIRCEKSTAYLKEQGFDEVYHLKGGILQYLKEVSREESMWQGECFVFDERVAVNHDLEIGSYDQCFACRYPIDKKEKLKPHYVKGISCSHCYQDTTDTQRQRFSAREKQIKLAKARNEVHLGDDVNQLREQKKNQKQDLKNAQRANKQ